MLSYDSSAIALSFVPAAGEARRPSRSGLASDIDILGPAEVETRQDDAFTYHHLRRSLYELSASGGVQVASRYTVPSAHLTIARFVSQEDISISPQERADDTAPDQLDAAGAGGVILDRKRVEKLIERIESINTWLMEEYWPKESQQGECIKEGGEWIVGEEKGLDCRKGTLWYGGGETVRLGKGF